MDYMKLIFGIFFKGIRFVPIYWFRNFEQNGIWDIGDYCVFSAYRKITLMGSNRIGASCIFQTKSSIDKKEGEIILQPRACIGANSVILPDVVIGENSIVGAGAVVTSGTRIPPNEVWAGVPAKFLKKVN